MHRNRLPEEVTESLSLHILKTLTGQPPLADPALSRKVELDNILSSFPASSILLFFPIFLNHYFSPEWLLQSQVYRPVVQTAFAISRRIKKMMCLSRCRARGLSGKVLMPLDGLLTSYALSSFILGLCFSV